MVILFETFCWRDLVGRLAVRCNIHINYRHDAWHQHDITSHDVTSNVSNCNQTYTVTLPSIAGADWSQGNNVSRVILRQYQIFRAPNHKFTFILAWIAFNVLRQIFTTAITIRNSLTMYFKSVGARVKTLWQRVLPEPGIREAGKGGGSSQLVIFPAKNGGKLSYYKYVS